MTASHWLVKSEPSKYAFEDLERDGVTVWDGVRNNSAALHLKAMKVSDQVFFYHSQEGLAVVGVAEVSKEAFLDPSDPAGRFVAVELKPVRRLKAPVTLAQMKANPALANMAMIRLFRLSVSPVTAEEWAAILAMAGNSAMSVLATCHCGACKIGLASAPDVATDCNCSICRRYGALWTYFDPAEVDMTGVGPTDIYMQGDRALEFHRCATCGVLTHWAPVDRSRPRMGVNARLLPLEVIKALRVRHLDGADTWTYLDE